jgi:IS1 family transposase
MDYKDYIKYGKDNHGRQRYKHKVAGTVTINPDNNRESYNKIVEKAIYLFAYEGIPLRKIARMFEVSHTTIMRWVYGRSKTTDYTSDIDVNTIAEVQIDEIYVITNKKKIRAEHEYMYVAIDQISRRILNFHYGIRSAKNTKVFLNNLLDKYKNIKIVHSDAYSPYKSYFKKVKFVNKIIHTVTKNLTTHIESLNSVIRHRLSAFDRRSRNFMKKSENLLSAFTMFSFNHNYQLS